VATSANLKLETLERTLEEERRRFGVVGMGVAVVREGELVLARGFGLRDLERRLPATESTLFAIGSSTKAFTATLIAALVGDGLLEWDRPVREYLPRFRLLDPVASELITPRDLLCHRSGLPRHDIFWYANPHLSRRELVERRLRHLEPNKTFRELWQYNNMMYLTAGFLAGELLGTSWEEGVRQRLLLPLGMGDTCFSPAAARQAGDWSRGYRDEDGAPAEIEQKDIPVAGPAGSIYSTVADIGKWIEVNLNQGRLGETEVIAPRALRELQSPAMVMAESLSPWPEKLGIGYGLGWFLESYRGHRLVHHGGNIDGYSAMVMMAPEARGGAVVLTNGNAAMLRDAAGYMVMDELLGLEPLPWGERLHGFQQAMRQGGRAATERRAGAARSVPHAHPLAAYPGEYNHPGYGTLEVSLAGETLTARYGELEMEMAHRHFETWDLDLGQVLERPIPLTFETDPDGELISLSVPFEPSVEPIVFRRLPPARLSDPEWLSRLAGDYVMGPLRARVGVERTRLTVELVGLQTWTLTPTAGGAFGVDGHPGIKVEFTPAEGRVREMVVQPGFGVFTAAPPSDS
jgi:CubicO group peptidase (beta-lactamase class C family)